MASDIARGHALWDSFFEHNPASRHRRAIIESMVKPLYKIVRLDYYTSILDVGCGGGQLLSYIAGRTWFALKLAGLDINRPEKPALLESLKATFYCADIDVPCSIPETYDVVIASEILEHSTNDRIAATNIAKMSREWVIVTVPAGKIYPTDDAMGHFQHYTEASLRSLFERHGFRTIACYRWGWPFHSLYRWVLNLMPKQVLRSFGQHEYAWPQRAVCNLLYVLFYFNVWGRGDQLFYLAKRT